MSRPAGRPSKALVAGGLVALAYVILAAVSGRLSPLARRPVLDGFVQPLPYHWVKPPPSLASGNKAPSGGSFAIPLDPSGSEAGVFSTKDLQVTIVLAQNAFASVPGQDSIGLTITPLDPAQFAPAPAGKSITGNVYRIQATLRPSGRDFADLRAAAQLAMAYPIVPNPHAETHTILTSADGMSWTGVTTIDSIAQFQVTANVRALSYFAVGQSGRAGGSGGGGSGNLIPIILIGTLVALALIAIIRFEVRERRSRRRTEADSRSGGGPKPPSGGPRRPGGPPRAPGGGPSRPRRPRPRRPPP